MSDYSGYSNDALVRVHAECKEYYFSLHAKVIRLRNRRQTGTPEYAEAMAEARLQFNVMVAIEDEGKRRGLTLTH